jgi:hypothetical protein
VPITTITPASPVRPRKEFEGAHIVAAHTYKSSPLLREIHSQAEMTLRLATKACQEPTLETSFATTIHQLRVWFTGNMADSSALPRRIVKVGETNEGMGEIRPYDLGKSRD